MEISSLSVSLKAMSFGRRNISNLNQQNLDLQVAIPKNGGFLPHKTFFEKKKLTLKVAKPKEIIMAKKYEPPSP